MPPAIERADNRATRVFGAGFGIAMMMLVPVLLRSWRSLQRGARRHAVGGQYTAKLLLRSR